MNWDQFCLGHYIDAGKMHVQTGPFGTQLRASDYTPVGTPVINVRNVGYGELREEKLEFVPDDVVQRLAKHLLQDGDIVFGRKGAVDRHLLVKPDHSGWMQGSDCIRLRVLSDDVLPDFLSFAMRIATHKEWMITQCSNKATMASLNQDVISRIPVRIPEPRIQKDIVEILSAYDDLIENNRRRILLLEESARLLYKEWFVRLRFPGHDHVKIVDGVPEGWALCPVPEVIHVKPKEKAEKGNKIRYIPMSCLSETGMTIEPTGIELREKSTSVKFRNGDVLFARITPCLENGKTGYVNMLENGELACGSTEFIVLRGKKVSSYYTYCLSRTYGFRENAIKSMIGSSGRQRVQESCFTEYMVYVPPRHIQTFFDEKVGTIFRQIQKLSEQNRALAQARDLLLPRLMNGEVAV